MSIKQRAVGADLCVCPLHSTALPRFVIIHPLLREPTVGADQREAPASNAQQDEATAETRRVATARFIRADTPKKEYPHTETLVKYSLFGLCYAP